MPDPPAAATRPHWIGNLFRLQPRDVPLGVALRNTAAIVLPLAAGVASGHVGAGLGVAVGALNTMFNDQPGPYRLRMQRMLLTALAAGLSGFVGSLIGANVLLLVPAALLWGIGGGMLVALGPQAGRAGLASMILLVVTAAQPRDAAGAAIAGLLLCAGGVLQMVFAIAAWPLQRYHPERIALAGALRQLATGARERPSPEQAPPVTQALLEVEDLLHGAHRARGPVMETFRVLAELIERARIELLALGGLHAALDGCSRQATLARLQEYAARALDGCADALERGSSAPAVSAAIEGVSAALGALREPAAGRRERRLLAIAAMRAEALAGELRALQRNVGIAGSRGALRAYAAEARLPRALRPLDSLAVLRANFNPSSVAFRHAMRCAICLALAVAGERAAGIPHGYWIPMTTAIVLKPDYAGTLRFGVLRVAGTLAGLVLGTLLVHYAFEGVVEQLLLLAVLCVGFRLLTTVHYGIGVMLLTGLVVVLLTFDGVPPGETMQARTLATVIGSAFALGAYAFWPTRERGRVKPALAQMLDAYRAYFLALVDCDAATRRGVRNAARNRRSNAQTSIERLRGEPRVDRRLLGFAEGVLANANRFVRACMAVEAIRIDDAALPEREAVDALWTRIDALLRTIIAALESGKPVSRATPPDARLREAERELAKRLDGSEDAAAAALADAIDRMTDSVDTLLHLLRQHDAPEG